MGQAYPSFKIFSVKLSNKEEHISSKHQTTRATESLAFSDDIMLEASSGRILS